MTKLITAVALVLAASGCFGIKPADTADFGEGPGPFPDFDGGVGFVGPQPVFGPTVSAAAPPPALSGGTLLMLHDGKTALAADADRGQAYLVDVSAASLKATIALGAADEPGRAVEDAAGKVHLVLRHAGVVATIDPATAAVTARTAVCPAPRGIAYEAANDRVQVACAGGELVSLPAGGGAAARTVTLDRDLRDVVVVGAQLWVSTFRQAQILILDGNGALTRRIDLPHAFDFAGEFSPSVAWRMLSLPGGGVGVVHQRGVVGGVQTTVGGYGGVGGGCGGIVQSAVSLIDTASLTVSSFGVGNTVLPVDIAYEPTSKGLAIVSAGNAHTPGLGQVEFLSPGNIVVPGGPPDMGGGFDGGMGGGGCDESHFDLPVAGEVISVAYDSTGQLWAQTREPATLQKVDVNNGAGVKVTLSSESRADTGFAVFHSNSGANIACASCHPEGGEDARVWEFDAIGPRRTQTLRGHVGGTEPFHWNGELARFDDLVGEVYLRRMAGPQLAPDQKQVLFAWINAIPLVPQSAPVDAAAVARGKTLFEDTTHAACSSCHSGPQLTNNASADVGTGGMFQVPRLVGVGFRAPFLHDGCAATLQDRFTQGCGGSGDLHGVTSSMTSAQIADLVAYLQTL